MVRAVISCRMYIAFLCMGNLEEVGGEGGEGVERGGAGADAGAVGVGDGEGDGGLRDAAHPPGAAEVPPVELGLLRARRRQDHRVPRRHAAGVPDRQPEAVP